MSEATVEELVEEAKKPGTFSIMNVIKDRAYPVETVNVYMDEDTAYLASEVKEKISKTDPVEKTYDSLNEELNTLLEKLNESKYVFTIKGISEAKREEINKLASQKYPIEYREDKNVYTGEVKREEIENEDRTNLFISLIWSAHIEKIVAPNGDIQEHISPEEVEELRGALPIASSAMINMAIEKIRTASAIFMMSVDEDFLAKS